MYTILFIVQFLSYLSLIVNIISNAPRNCHPKSPVWFSRICLGAKALVHDNLATTSRRKSWVARVILYLRTLRSDWLKWLQHFKMYRARSTELLLLRVLSKTVFSKFRVSRSSSYSSTIGRFRSIRSDKQLATNTAKESQAWFTWSSSRWCHVCPLR